MVGKDSQPEICFILVVQDWFLQRQVCFCCMGAQSLDDVVEDGVGPALQIADATQMVQVDFPLTTSPVQCVT